MPIALGFLLDDACLSKNTPMPSQRRLRNTEVRSAAWVDERRHDREQVQRIATALLEAAECSDGRLPELFCGFSRDQVGAPVPYPTACSPQAWAATTPIHLVASLMRYNADVSLGGLWMDPVLPASFGDLHITNAPIAGGRINIDITNSVPTVEGLPAGMTFHRSHRPWLAEVVEQADGGRSI